MHRTVVKACSRHGLSSEVDAFSLAQEIELANCNGEKMAYFLSMFGRTCLNCHFSELTHSPGFCMVQHTGRFVWLLTEKLPENHSTYIDLQFANHSNGNSRRLAYFIWIVFISKFDKSPVEVKFKMNIGLFIKFLVFHLLIHLYLTTKPYLGEGVMRFEAKSTSEIPFSSRMYGVNSLRFNVRT